MNIRISDEFFLYVSAVKMTSGSYLISPSSYESKKIACEVTLCPLDSSKKFKQVNFRMFDATNFVLQYIYELTCERIRTDRRTEKRTTDQTKCAA